MKKIPIIITFMVLCAVPPAAAQGIAFLDQPEWEKVLESARRQGKPIFMDCYTEWCGPCRMLAEKVFPRPEAGEFFNANFINVKYDMEKGEGKVLYERYKPFIVGFPTLLLIDPDGNVIHQMAGYHQPAELIAGMRDGMEGRGLPALRKIYAQGERRVDFISEYAAALNRAVLRDEAEAVMGEFIRSLPPDSLLSPRNWALAGEYVKDPGSPEFEHALRNLTMLVRRQEEDGYRLERRMSGALDRAVDDLTRMKRDENDDPLPLTDDSAKVAKLRSLIDINNLRRAETQRAILLMHELKLSGEWSRALDCLEHYSRIDALGYGDRFASETIHHIALNCSDTTILNRCLEIMERIQASEEDKERSANRQNIVAAIYRSLGDAEKAARAQSLYDEYRSRVEAEWENMLNK